MVIKYDLYYTLGLPCSRGTQKSKCFKFFTEECTCCSVDHRSVFVAVWVTEVYLLQSESQKCVFVAVWITEMICGSVDHRSVYLLQCRSQRCICCSVDHRGVYVAV